MSVDLRSARADVVRQLEQRVYLLPSEAAFLFNRSKRTINRWIADGLPTYRVDGSRHRYVKRADIRAWLAAPEGKTRPPRRSKLYVPPSM